MENKHENEIRRSFFKFMIPKFALKLRIPTHFVEKYGNILLVKQAKLRNNSGEIWNVKLERSMDDGEYYFTKGWEKFVKDFRVKVRECVIFTYAKKSIFDVAVYGIDGMERGFSDNPKPDQRDQKDVQIVEPKGNVPVKEMSPLYFEMCHMKYQTFRLQLRKPFATAVGLKHEEYVKLEYVPTGASWDVRVYLAGGKFKMTFAKGWSAFRQANLTDEKMYSFEYKPNKVIEVNEV